MIIQEELYNIAESLKNDRVLIYGTGKLCNAIFKQFDMSKFNIIGFVDKSYANLEEKTFMNFPVFSPNQIKEITFDTLLVMIKNTDCIAGIINIAKNYGKNVIILNNKLPIGNNGYIFDGFGSYKEYLLENNMPEIIQQYELGLDEESIKIFKKSLKKMLYCQDFKFLTSDFNLKLEDFLLDKEDVVNYQKFKDSVIEYKNKYILAHDEYNPDVFYFRHGLVNASPKLLNYIKNKDFIDGGAYIGDSATMLMDYNPNKIYSFEISDKSIKKYMNTMELNKISKNKYEILNIGLAEKYYETTYLDMNSQGSSIYFDGKSKLVCSDLDTIVQNKNMNVGFIKADIEGAMCHALKGMKNTIKKFRPVLDLTIDHSPKEFFESKFLLDEYTKDLNYKIELQWHDFTPSYMFDFVLFAYPKELI